MIKWQLVAMATCQTLLRISVFELPESFILLKIIYIYIYIYIHMQIYAGIYPNFSTNICFVAEDHLMEEQLWSDCNCSLRSMAESLWGFKVKPQNLAI